MKIISFIEDDTTIKKILKHFVHIPETWKHRAIEIWQDKVFELLLNEKKIDQETVAGMRT